MLDKIHYNVTEAATYCHVHRTTIHDWIKQGKLKAYKLGGKTIIFQSDLDALLIPIN